MDLLKTEILEREREVLGVGRWSVALLLLALVGIPIVLGVHMTWFAGSAEAQLPTVSLKQSYHSLDDAPALFDPITGAALVRYCGDPAGDVELYSGDVLVSPRTGKACEPITQAIVEAIRDAEAGRVADTDAAIAAKAQAERQRRQAAEAASARHAEAAFRDRYVRSAALATSPSSVVLLKVDGAVESRLAQKLRGHGYNVNASALTTAVFENAMFSELSAGNANTLRRLGLTSVSGTMVLGRTRFDQAKETGVGNTVNVKGYATVHIISLPSGQAITMPQVTETGAGFDETQARTAAETRLVEALVEQGLVRRLSS